MIIKDLENFTKAFGRIDAIFIVNKDDIIEYSAMVEGDKKSLTTEDILGKNLYEVYPTLNKENSTHAQVMKTGLPVLNVKQTLTDIYNKTSNLITSTFPILDNGIVIGTIDMSIETNPDPCAVSKKTTYYTLDDIVTNDKSMLLLKEKIRKIANTTSSVLIVGESGTGKELIAESLHTESNRASNPFISLNCAAIPDSLMESTLFGTVKGSFTGSENKKGLFELANNGTLFLDEINSMPIELQTKLLKVVEEQRFMKLGGEKYISVNVRIISAMNKEPSDEISYGKLRNDLYYRLGVLRLDLPPLRDRRSDIPLLVDHFIKHFNLKLNKNIEHIDLIANKFLTNYYWPGNIRELKNTMEASISLATDNTILLGDLPEHLITEGWSQESISDNVINGSLQQMMDEYEKNILINILSNSRNLTDAANKLKITRQALKYKINKHQIDYLSIINQ